MSEPDFSEYEDGWYEYFYCKISKGKKRHAIISYLGDKITDQKIIDELENRINVR